MKIVDYSWARPGGAALKDKYVGAMRYLSFTPGKNLTPSELNDLNDNGLSVGIVWEATAQAPLLGFAQGVADAKSALLRADNLNFPHDKPIYFACDFDCSTVQLPLVDEYLKGCSSIIGLARIGVYGSYAVVKNCYLNKTATYFWQTLAWSHGQHFAFNHIYQNGQGDCGGGCDVNDVFGDWGGWDGTPPIIEVATDVSPVPENPKTDAGTPQNEAPTPDVTRTFWQKVEDFIIYLMETPMEKIKAFLQSKEVETALWQAANVLVGALIVYLSGQNFAWAAVVIPLLNAFTKFVNLNFIK